MNGSLLRTLSRRRGLGTGALAVATAAAAATLAGCGSKDNFGKVNGQVISKDEYIQALERAPVSLGQPGGQQAQINAGRFVLDQIVGKKVVLAEAAKNDVMPSDADVQKFYDVRKRIFEQQTPGKTFEAAMKEQGTTSEEIRQEMQYQLAETGLLAKRIGLKEDELKKQYDQAKGQFGLPERVQLRVIVTPANSKNFQTAQKLLADKTDFQEVARQVNPAQLRANGGLLPQVTPLAQTPPAWQGKIKQTAEGASFGPVDAPGNPGQPVTKAWVRVEKKLPAFNLSFDDAKPLIRQQLVQVKMLQPENARYRNEIVKLKMDAQFQASEPKYMEVWQAVKENAAATGVGADMGAAAAAALPAAGQ